MLRKPPSLTTLSVLDSVSGCIFQTYLHIILLKVTPYYPFTHEGVLHVPKSCTFAANIWNASNCWWASSCGQSSTSKAQPLEFATRWLLDLRSCTQARLRPVKGRIKHMKFVCALQKRKVLSLHLERNHNVGAYSIDCLCCAVNVSRPSITLSLERQPSWNEKYEVKHESDALKQFICCQSCKLSRTCIFPRKYQFLNWSHD